MIHDELRREHVSQVGACIEQMVGRFGDLLGNSVGLLFTSNINDSEEMKPKSNIPEDAEVSSSMTLVGSSVRIS